MNSKSLESGAGSRAILALSCLIVCAATCTGQSGWPMLTDMHPDRTRIWDMAPPPRLPIPPTSTPPTIDGDLDDDCWRQATAAGALVWSFTWDDGSGGYPMGYVAPRAASDIRVCRDAEFLYIAARLDEPHMDQLQTAQENLWWNDHAFLRISPDYFTTASGQFPSFFSVLVEAANRTRGWALPVVGPGTELKDAREDDGGVLYPGLRSAVKQHEEHWVIEFAFPFAALPFPAPAAGDIWGGDFGRMRWAPKAARSKGVTLDRRTSPMECSAWSGTGDNPLPFNVRLGEWLFTDTPVAVRPLGFSTHFLGPGTAGVELFNGGTAPVTYQLVLSSYRADGTRVLAEKEVTVPADTRQTVEVAYAIRQEGAQVLILEVNDGDRCLARLRQLCNIENLSEQLAALETQAKTLGTRADEQGMADSPFGVRVRELGAKVVELEARRKQSLAEGGKGWSAIAGDMRRVRDVLGLAVWHVHPYLPVRADALPPTLEQTEIEINAAGDEIMNTALVLTNLTNEILEVRLKADAPGFASMHMRPITGVMDMGDCAYWHALGPAQAMAVNRAEFNGQLLLPHDPDSPVVLPPLSSRQVWLTFRTHGLEPGSHKGTVQVAPLSTTLRPVSVPVQLKVWDFVLPAVPRLKTHLWDAAQSPAHIEDLLNHKINVFQAARKQQEPPQAELVTMLTERVGDRFEVLFGHGLLRLFTQKANREGWEYRSERWQTEWSATVRAHAEHVRSTGLPLKRYAVVLWDEARAETADMVVEAARLAKAAVPELRLAQTLYNQKYHGLIDVWIFHGGVWPEARERLRQEGAEIWSYSCAYPIAPTDPVQYALLRPWHARRQGIDGIGIFNYQQLIANVLIPGAQRFFLPHWPMLRAGIQDHQYFEVLDYLVTAAEGKGAAAVMARAAAAREVATNVLATVLDDDGPDNKRLTADYLTARAKARALLAREILALQNLVNRD